jgi:hypothetical protein
MPEQEPELIDKIKEGDLIMSGAEDEVLQTMFQAEVKEKRSIPFADLRYDTDTRANHMLKHAVDATHIFDDRRFINCGDHEYTTINITQNASLDLVNIRGLVHGSARNEMMQSKILSLKRFKATNGGKVPVEKPCKGEKCSCDYCYVKKLDPQYLKAFSAYLLGCYSALDKPSHEGTADLCIFPLIIHFNAPAEIRDSSGLLLTEPVYRTLPPRRLHVSHVVAASTGLDVRACNAHGRPIDLPMTCKQWRCINKQHYVNLRRNSDYRGDMDNDSQVQSQAQE